MFRRSDRPAAHPETAAAGEQTEAAGTLLLRDTARVEAFSDGVFAIAVTLLVLNLHLPDDKGDLAESLLGNWRDYVVYVISFSFILIMWINHHNMLRVIRGTDHTFLLLNGLLLLFVTVVPFTTGLLPHYSSAHNETVAAVIYSANYLLIAFAFNFLWWWAVGRGRLLAAEYDTAFVRTTNRRYRSGPLLYLVCVALAFVSVPASLALNVVLAVFFAWPHSLRPPTPGHNGEPGTDG